MAFETEQERMDRLDKEAGARGRVRYSGPKAARRHYDREEQDKSDNTSGKPEKENDE